PLSHDDSSVMTLQDRSELVLGLARVLHVNGQSTDETVAAAEELAKALRLRASIVLRWGEVQLEAADRDARFVSIAAANPTGVDMDRVASATRAAGELGAGRLRVAAFQAAIDAIAAKPPAPTWLFALAAAAGAAALAVLFGAQHLTAVTLIVI